MVILSREPAPDVSEEERNNKIAEAGHYLRKNKQTGKLSAVKKRPKKKSK